MGKVSLSAMEKILRDAGAERVSKSAKVALAELLETHGEEVSKKALRFATHSGRKTVTAKDIELAKKSGKDL